MKKILLILISAFFTFNLFSQNYDYVSAEIKFVVNTDRVIENAEYSKFRAQVIPYLRTNIDKIQEVRLIGSASPEGNKENNRNLSIRRASRIKNDYLYFLPKDKVNIYYLNDDYSILSDFGKKVYGITENDYQELRAVYLDVVFKKDELEPEEKVVQKNDTVKVEKIVYKERVDTVYKERVDTVYKDKVIKFDPNKHDRLAFSLYNSITTDLMKTGNLGFEVYFENMSYFLEGEFSDTDIFSREFRHDLWHTGFRKYFNSNYDRAFIEFYLRTGYYDIDFGANNGKYGLLHGAGFGLGYKFNLCRHVKLYPFIRFGYDRLMVAERNSNQGNGNVNVSFNDYTDYRSTERSTNTQQAEYNSVYNNYSQPKIDADFYDKCDRGHWVGPTYAGLIIQVDLYKLKKEKQYEKDF